MHYAFASSSRLLLAQSSRPARLRAPRVTQSGAFRVCVLRTFAQSASASAASKHDASPENQLETINEISKGTSRKMTHAERDAALREAMLERDGGPASVPTRGGNWDQELGPNTAKHMHRVLDQVRNGKGAETIKERRFGKSAVEGWKEH